MENLTPGDIINSGVNLLTVYLLVRVLNRLDSVTDRLFTYLENARTERRALLLAQGVIPPGELQ